MIKNRIAPASDDFINDWQHKRTSQRQWNFVSDMFRSKLLHAVVSYSNDWQQSAPNDLGDRKSTPNIEIQYKIALSPIWIRQSQRHLDAARHERKKIDGSHHLQIQIYCIITRRAKNILRTSCKIHVEQFIAQKIPKNSLKTEWCATDSEKSQIKILK